MGIKGEMAEQADYSIVATPGGTAVLRGIGVLACLAIMALANGRVRGADTEHQVKGGYLYNFTKFVDWPSNAFANPDTPIVIGILGEDPFGRQFDEAMKTETSKGRRLEVRRCKDAADAGRVHILFIPASENARLPAILEALEGRSILIVGESDGFTLRGGHIGFFIEDGKVRFEINQDAAKRAKLKISSDLLNLARNR